MKTIVSLVDFSDVTPRVLQETEKLGRALGARVLVVHVLEPQPMVVDLGIASPTIMQEPTEAMVEKDRAKLQEICHSLTAAGLAAEVSQWSDGSVDHVVQQIREIGPEMVIVGSHHHGALFRWLIGGLGNDLLKNAPCPILVVPNEPSAS